MKGKDIKLNEEYAVGFAVRGLPASIKPVRRCVALAKRANGKVVVSYDAMVQATPLEATHFTRLLGMVGWRKGHREAVVSTSDFIAPWSDWTPPGVLDGRPASERPRSVVVDGVTYVEQSMAAA